MNGPSAPTPNERPRSHDRAGVDGRVWQRVVARVGEGARVPILQGVFQKLPADRERRDGAERQPQRSVGEPEKRVHQRPPIYDRLRAGKVAAGGATLCAPARASCSELRHPTILPRKGKTP